LGSLYKPSNIDFVSAAEAVVAELKEKIWSGTPVRPTATIAAAAIRFVATLKIFVLRVNDVVRNIVIRARRQTRTLLLPTNTIVESGNF
jgi:hypothetical protein